MSSIITFTYCSKWISLGKVLEPWHKPNVAPNRLKFKLKYYWGLLEYTLSELGWCVFDRLETRVQHYPNAQNPSNIIINLLDPTLFEIPQDCSTGNADTRIQQTVGDDGLGWQDNVHGRTPRWNTHTDRGEDITNCRILVPLTDLWHLWLVVHEKGGHGDSSR